MDLKNTPTREAIKGSLIFQGNCHNICLSWELTLSELLFVFCYIYTCYFVFIFKFNGINAITKLGKGHHLYGGIWVGYGYSSIHIWGGAMKRSYRKWYHAHAWPEVTGRGPVLKKYSDSQCCWKKNSDFDVGKKNNVIQSFCQIT